MKIKLSELKQMIKEVTNKSLSETKSKSTVKYGPTIENMFLIQEKAHSQKDGIYSFRGLLYHVQNKRFIHYAYAGEIFERLGYFSVKIGKCERSQSEMRKALKSLGSK